LTATVKVVIMALNQVDIVPNSKEDTKASNEAVPLQYLDLAPHRRLAYRKVVGHIQPTILYIPGFFADMNMRKTVVLEEYAREFGYSNVRYDQEVIKIV
jgi:hypothetical protein